MTMLKVLRVSYPNRSVAILTCGTPTGEWVEVAVTKTLIDQLILGVTANDLDDINHVIGSEGCGPTEWRPTKPETSA